MKLFPLRMILVPTALMAYRYLLQTFAALTHWGASGGFVRSCSRLDLIQVLEWAIGASVRGLPPMLRQRRAVQRERRLGHRDYLRVQRRLSATELALKD